MQWTKKNEKKSNDVVQRMKRKLARTHTHQNKQQIKNSAKKKKKSHVQSELQWVLGNSEKEMEE